MDALFALQATIPSQCCGGIRGEGIGVGQSNEMHDLLGDKRTLPASKLSIWGSREKSRESRTRKETLLSSTPCGFVARSRVLSRLGEPSCRLNITSIR